MLLLVCATALLMPFGLPRLDPQTRELHEPFGLSFQVLFHFDSGIQSFNIIPQIERLSSPNTQSSTYHSTSAAEYPLSSLGLLTTDSFVRSTSNNGLGDIIGIADGESFLSTKIGKAFGHRGIHDPGRDQIHSIAQILHLRPRRTEQTSDSPFRCGVIDISELKVACQRAYDCKTLSEIRPSLSLGLRRWKQPKVMLS